MFKVGDVIRFKKEQKDNFKDKPDINYIITKIWDDYDGDYKMIQAIGEDNRSIIGGIYEYRFELAINKKTNKSKYST